MGACFSCKSRRAKEEMLRKNRKRKYLNDFSMVSKKMTSFKEDRLHRNQDRMFLNGSSETASLFLQKGNKGVNQDAMIVWENFGSRADTTFCGVFDGHGPSGHMVSKRVRNFLPMKLSEHWEDNRKSGSNSEIFDSVKETFLDVFELTDKELRDDPYFDCACSGSTAVALVKQGQDLIIGYIGNSRAVLGMRGANNGFIPVQLTVDLKPDLPAEKKRIRKCKGRIFALRDEPRVARVWLPHSNTPGLTMSRVFGDFCLKDYGVISVPEISHRRIIDDDEFVVLATHGVWAVLSNEDVVNIVGTCPTRSYAARAVVDAAVKEWSYMYPTSKVEECAVVCLFLNSEESSTLSAKSTAPKEDKAKHYPDPCELNRSDSTKTGCGAIEEG
ncbi:hypothetical protein SASPL_136957 [Salvia splendens]|uniref:PPM-type phosphatase domain-containing protein n=1 Tax=Salvia splendens TaxID=180675 RepID=A0A8X8X1U3_SALSN|nr:probable protein phosphatase 2C 33 [Salvia splendens]XP_042015047.1 probable protein phosphatase 2C 33 [Salvia splendens]KAG6404704.1 hypothetical protein SASPL_136957 [Salvia splendens]